MFFHASDVYLYREALVLEAHDVIYDILPVGLNVRFDALRIRSDCQEVKTSYIFFVCAPYFATHINSYLISFLILEPIFGNQESILA